MTSKADAIVTLARNVNDAESLAQQYAISQDRTYTGDVYTFDDNSVLTVGVSTYIALACEPEN